MAMHPIDGIPDFCRISPEERAAAWRGRKLTRQGTCFGKLDAAEQRARTKLQREYDRQQAEKRARRLQQLRENY
jgi:hypothetical protein